MSSSPVLRPYGPTDEAAALDVWERASRVGHPFLSERFLAEERGRLADEWLPGAQTTVAELDEQVVAWMSLVGHEVGGLFVAPEHHGRGIGRTLLAHAATLHPVLELDVFEQNTVGRRFYGLFGFEVVGRHTNAEVGQVELRLRFEQRGRAAAGVTGSW